MGHGMSVAVIAAVDFDGDVAQPRKVGQAHHIVVDRQRRIRHQRDDGGMMAGTDAPDMQVGDTGGRDDVSVMAIKTLEGKTLGADSGCTEFRLRGLQPGYGAYTEIKRVN
jgi:hypothetical protein